MELQDFNQFNYMATQKSVHGLDEIQQLFLCYATGCHVALSGPPGVGKTTLVEEFAQKIKQNLVSRVMGPKVNESLLISYPDLVSKNGVSVTVTRPGLLAKALKNNCIYFADEIDRLTEDNQKLHNSAFDDRCSVTLRDSRKIKGKSDFFGIIAYNPTEGLKNDLEPALADRFIHIGFDYFRPEIEAMVTLKKAGLASDGGTRKNMELKAILFRNNGKKSLQFFDLLLQNGKQYLVHPHTKFKHPMDNKSCKSMQDHLFLYLSYQTTGGQEKETEFTAPQTLKVDQLGLKLAEFCNDIRCLAQNKLQNLDSGFLADFRQQNENLEMNNIRLHTPSSRIQQAALKQFDYLTNKMKFPVQQAQVYAVHMIVNQAAFGKFGTRKLGKTTNRDMLLNLAAVKGLLPLKKQRKLDLKKTRPLTKKYKR